MEYRLASAKPVSTGKEEMERRERYFQYYEEHAGSPLPAEGALTADAARARIEAAHDSWTHHRPLETARFVRVDKPDDFLSKPIRYLPNQPDPTEVARAGFLGLAYGFLPSRRPATRVPFIALVYRHAYFGRRVFSKIASWADNPASRRDDQGIVVSFVDEPDGGYSFYLYPRTPPRSHSDEESMLDSTPVAFTVIQRGFAPDSRAAFDEIRPHLALSDYALCGGDTEGNLFEDSIVLKCAPRLLRRDQVGPNEVEQPLLYEDQKQEEAR